MYYGRSRGAAIKFEGLRRTPKWWYATFLRIFSIVSFWSLSGRKVTVPRLSASPPGRTSSKEKVVELLQEVRTA